MRKLQFRIAFFAFLLVISCADSNKPRKENSNSEKLFTLIPNSQTNVHFKNSVEQSAGLNFMTYNYVYNGAGVGVADINNDNLQDIYLISNQGSNKLYLNKGDFIFEDITEKAGVSDKTGWSTGVTIIDINNDGWLDLYVCKSASLENETLRKNKLFVNQKDGTFKDEASKWGLDNNGYSIQSYFFDYDKDGDLDMYLVNHGSDFSIAGIMEDKNTRKYYSETSDHLFRNEGNKFGDITHIAGVKNKEFGLSASIGDFNNDDWPDIYVANDFIGSDYMYINNKNGTFTDKMVDVIQHASFNSMGSDYADINNDLLPDLLVLDMMSDDHSRGKQNMASMNTDGFWKMVNQGYNYSYMANTLNLNNGNGTFSDIAQLSGISATDWSWSPIIADFDNDGYKDVFISNGIQRELGNQDYNAILKEKQEAANEPLAFEEIVSIMPSEKLPNHVFKNNRDLSFTKVAKEWGINHKVNTNGVAYADFDNDGDLDLVLNNMEDKASIYQNNSINNFINIKLIGNKKNINAIGARVKVYTDKTQQYQELYLSRGYQSSVSPILNFGIGDEEKINRIEVIWADTGKALAQDNVEVNQTLTFNQKDFNFDGETKTKNKKYFTSVKPNQLGIEYKHEENDFNDFSLQVLLPQKQSQQGPAFDVADVNNDGLDDVFLGGALNQPAEMWFQTSDGKFKKENQDIFENDKAFEDNNVHFFDANADGYVDIYVASGGYELEENNPLLQDRLYLNDGKGNYKKTNKLPKMLTSTKAIKSIDFDKDGDMDLVVGGRVVPGKYPLVPRSYVLQNNNGNFIDVTKEVASEFSEVGLVNDLIFSDYDNDNDKDLIVVGEWMPITVFENTNGNFLKVELSAFEKTSGWWNTISEIDFDNDGDMDYFVGNLGANNKFHPSEKKPLHIYGNNFDEDAHYDMILSKIYNGNLVPIRGKECSTEQNPFVSQKIESYKEFANSTLGDIYGNDVLENSYHKEVYEFKSVYIENKGDGNFELKYLPTIAQLGPTMAFAFEDVNKDGNKDVIGIGAIHEAEVETVRYDSNVGYVLFGDSKGKMKSFKDISFYNNLNAKSMKTVNIGSDTYLFIANNDAELKIFKINENN